MAGETESSAASVGGEPDPDTIKMFVGQIPRAWNEEDCKKFFEEFGPVHSLNVLRDRSNNVSKGCCFVTFFHRKDALNAQNTLHNVRVLPSMHHAMQVKPADSENQRKLFIGMLGKNMSESDVKAAFQEFGQIDDCTVLRDIDGKSRGCGFITFVTRNCAQLAIRKMHQAKTFEGCTKPVVVKFADTPKDKEIKKSALASALGGAAGGGVLSRLLAPAAAANPTAALLAQLLQPQQPAQNAANQLLSGLQALLPLLNTAVAQQNQSQQPAPQQHQSSSHRTQHQQQQQSSFGSQQMSELLQQQKLMEILNKASGNAPKNDANAQLAQLLLSAQNGGSASGSVSPPRYNPEPDYFQHQQQQQQQPSLQSTLLTQLQAFTQMGGAGGASASGGGGGGANSFSSTLQAALAGASGGGSSAAHSATDYASLLAGYGGGGGGGGASAASQSKGPEGCNLFIYHLPQDFTDTELHALFSLFGNVISANVFIDKQTNMSKCFGFVSYDNAASAQKAISGMNGFQIGSKRLKVQVKRGKDKPYQRGANGGGGATPPRGGSVSPSDVNALVNNFLSGQKYAAAYED